VKTNGAPDQVFTHFPGMRSVIPINTENTAYREAHLLASLQQTVLPAERKQSCSSPNPHHCRTPTIRCRITHRAYSDMDRLLRRSTDQTSQRLAVDFSRPRLRQLAQELDFAGVFVRQQLTFDVVL
jgi:hypothetical protein